MRNFQDTFETPKRSFINAFSICMSIPLNFDVIDLEIKQIIADKLQLP